MDTGVIIALILGASSIIASIFYGYIPSIRKQKIEKLQTKIQKLNLDIEFWYKVESELLEQLSAQTGKNKETLKKEVREIVSKRMNDHKLSDYSKPSIFHKNNTKN